MCVGCREMKNKRGLLRIVRTPEGEIELDVTGKKAGRGAYVCPNIDCFNQAIKRKSLHKALEKEIPQDILERLKEEISGIELNN
jgi:hypothetical protein